MIYMEFIVYTFITRKSAAFPMLWDHTNEVFMKTTLKSKWDLVKRELIHEFPELAVAGMTADKYL